MPAKKRIISEKGSVTVHSGPKSTKKDGQINHGQTIWNNVVALDDNSAAQMGNVSMSQQQLPAISSGAPTADTCSTNQRVCYLIYEFMIYLLFMIFRILRLLELRTPGPVTWSAVKVERESRDKCTHLEWLCTLFNFQISFRIKLMTPTPLKRVISISRAPP